MKKTTKLISTVLAVVTISSLMTCSTFAESNLRPPTKGKDTNVSSKVGSRQRGGGVDNKKNTSADKTTSASSAMNDIKSTKGIINPNWKLLSNPVAVEWETPATFVKEEARGTFFYGDAGAALLTYLGTYEVNTAKWKAYQTTTDIKSETYTQTANQLLLDEFNEFRGLEKAKYNNNPGKNAEVDPNTSKAINDTYNRGGIVATDQGVASSTAIDKIDAAAYAKEVIEFTNKERKKVGASLLKIDDDLMKAAQTRAKELVENYSHTRPNGDPSTDMVVNAGYSKAGENAARYQTSAQNVVTAWMNSRGHKANLLRSSFTHIGVGCYQTPDGTLYWVQLFGG